MKLTPGIRQLGFKKWYERELLQGHAHMVLALLCLIAVGAAFEASTRFHAVDNQITNIVGAFVAGGVGVWAVRRYLYLFSHAQCAANQADCPSCGTYARFKLVREKGDDCAGVQCRKCEHEWTITDF